MDGRRIKQNMNTRLSQHGCLCVYLYAMRTTPSFHRSPVLHDLEPELPLLIIGACMFASTIVAVYLYASVQ